jgi:FKBP-type peptidyl-prolyl cis-trans isomerase SlyD
MQIGPKTAVTIAYTLKDEQGEVLDSSDGRDPLTYLHGVGSIVPGLERALDGKGDGDEIDVVVTPADGYGMRDEKLVRNMPVRRLPDGKAKVGMRYPVQTDTGTQVLLVTALRGDYATVDGNHPLAGMTLNFHIKVVGVREATAEEQAHGHVHGPGDHHH